MNVKNEKELIDLALSAAWEKDNPRLAWMLSELAGISSVRFSDDIESACIKKIGEKYRIMFSPSFVRKYLSTPDDVLFVLLHEILHKVQGDLVRDLRIRNRIDEAVANMVEDIVINARLCRLFFPYAVPLFEKIYHPDQFPEILLIPPVILELYRGRHIDKDPLYHPWNDSNEYDYERMMEGIFWSFLKPVFKQVKNLPEAPPKFSSNPGLWEVEEDACVQGLWLWYFRAWSASDKVTVADLYYSIRPLFPDPPDVILIGDHDHIGDGIPGWDDVFGEHGAGYSEDEKEDEIDVQVPHQHVTKMMRMIRRALEPDLMNPLEAFTIQPERSVMPWPGRRENLWLARGLWPVFFKPPVYTKDLDYFRPHLYIDVSASTGDYQPMIYGLVFHCSDLIGEPIYLFSNTVAEAKIEDIKTGKVRTTGGTDFDCVMEHALKNRFKKIIIITDGQADMNEKNQAKVKSGEVEISLVLTENTPHLDAILKEHVKNIFYLNA